MRRKDREVTNIIEILQIIEKAKVLHLALFDADYPYIVPLHDPSVRSVNTPLL